jgi:hypothetical protein
LLVVEEDGGVVRAWAAEPARLTDFLNDMSTLTGHGDTQVDEARADPAAWGDLVIARSADGDVLFIDPELYWNGIADHFRSRGNDPHLYRARL